MPKFNIDYSSVIKQINKKAYRLSDVKDQLETVAFDIVRFRDNDKGAALWQVQCADDGDYIVALYDDDNEIEKTASTNPWDVSVSKDGSEMQIAYKGDPLIKFTSSKLGIPSYDLYKVERYLPEKLATNKKLVKALLSELSEEARREVYRRYPELI